MLAMVSRKPEGYSSKEDGCGLHRIPGAIPGPWQSHTSEPRAAVRKEKRAGYQHEVALPIPQG